MKLPQEYESPFAKTRAASDTEEVSTVSIKKKTYDVISASAVFLLTLISLFASFSINPNNPAIFESVGDGYLVSTLPFCTSLGWFIMGLFFIVKAFRYKSCIYAKITSISFFTANLMTLIQSIFVFDWAFYSAVWDFIMIVGVILVSIVWLVKTLTNKE